MKRAPICIIGNSISAVSFIETLRQKGNREDIVLLNKEPYPAYGRPLISYLLAGKISRNNIFLRKPDFYLKNNVEFYPQTEVVKVDLNTRECLVQNGRSFPFQKLLVASGGKPFVPPLEGMEKAGNVFTFTSLDDALRIDSCLDKVSNIVILGAGLIGLKAAEALSCRGKNISMIELSDRILPAVLDQRGSSLFRERMEKDGIHFHFKETIDKIISEKGKLKTVLLKSGLQIPCDLLVIAIGVKPNTAFLGGQLLSEKNAVKVNRYMQTEIDGIYAAGDVSESYDLLYNTVRNMPLWPNAHWQGHFAALSMTGVSYDFQGHISMNSIGYKDLPMMSAGIIEDPELPIDRIELAEAKSYRRFNFQGERLVGMLFVGDVEDKGVLAHLLKHQEMVPSLKEKIQNRDFSFLDFPREFRSYHFLKVHGKI